MSEFVMLDLSAPPPPLSFAGSLTVRDAQQIHARLLKAVHEQQSITVDCGAATEIDLSFIQLMLAARRSSEACGKTLSLVPPATDVLSSALRSAGILGCAEPPPSADQLFWLDKETN